MKTELSYAELHAPLFLAGKNHGLKLRADASLKLFYDEELKELHVSYNNKKARLPYPSVHSMEEVPVPIGVPDQPKPQPVVDKSKRSSAQVSTPQSHVFK